MRILVTGANGQLGRSIADAAVGSSDEYIFTDVEELDITDSAMVESYVAATAPDVIVNCAAYTNVDAAEDDGDLARRLNGDAAGFLARAAAGVGAYLIHISTDYVFGGELLNTPISEDAAESPLGVYGVTKLEGEREVEASGVKAIVIRTAWLYSEYGKNFLKTMRRLTSERPEVRVVVDQVGSPTYAGDLAMAIVGIITRRQLEGSEGTYHYSNEGVCSWYDFAKAIARLNGASAKVLPCRSSEYPSKVNRPAYSVLDKSKFKSTFAVEIPYWMESLAKCNANMKS